MITIWQEEINRITEVFPNNLNFGCTNRSKYFILIYVSRVTINTTKGLEMKTYRVWHKTFIDIEATSPKNAEEIMWDTVDLDTPVGDTLEIEELNDEEETT